MSFKEGFQKAKNGLNALNTVVQILDKNVIPNEAKKAEEDRLRKEKEAKNKKIFIYASIGSGILILGLILLLYFKNKNKVSNE